MSETTCPGEPGFKCSDQPGWKGLCKRCYFRKYARDNADTARRRNRQWKRDHPEKVAAYNTQWRRDNRERVNRTNNAARRRDPDFPEKNRLRSRQWAKANPEKIKAGQRRHYEENRDRILEQNRRWREANPEKWAELSRRRRARERNALQIPFTTEQLADRMAFWGNRCWMCGGPFEQVDHVIPIARGGPHCLSNLRPACQSCNASKGARTPNELEGDHVANIGDPIEIIEAPAPVKEPVKQPQPVPA